MNKDREYIIVVAFSVNVLEQYVSRRMGDGYIPVGGVTHVNGSVCQAMVRKQQNPIARLYKSVFGKMS